MRLRWVVLLILPVSFAALVAFVGWLSIRASEGVPGPRYSDEADLALLLLPSLIIYLIALPVLRRRLVRLTVSELALFSALATLLDLGLLWFSAVVAYPFIGRWYPVAADQFFFFVVPFFPIVVSISLALAAAIRLHARAAAEQDL